MATLIPPDPLLEADHAAKGM